MFDANVTIGYLSMSTASGYPGSCDVKDCKHLNNEHKYEKCGNVNCNIKWKRCQVTGKCNGVHYRICKSCVGHNKPDGW